VDIRNGGKMGYVIEMDLPAVEFADGTKLWYKMGVLYHPHLLPPLKFE
jgi:hypothetical protein